MSGRRLVVALAVVLGSLCSLGGIILLALTWSVTVPDAWGFRGFTILFAVSYGGVGALLAFRRPQNRVGWVILASGTAGGIQMFLEGYAIYGILGRLAPLPGAIAAAWVESWLWLVGTTLIVTYALLLFPNGSFVSPRWRIVGWLAAANLTLGVAGLAFADGPLNSAPFVDNPVPLLGDLGQPLFFFSFLGFLLLAFASTVSLVVRFRRARGVERQQLKWLAFVAMIIAVTIIITGVSQAFARDFKPAELLFIAALCLMPIAIGVGVLRYRLFDIDLVINRAMVYGATTAGIAVAFFGAIVVLQTLLRPFTSGSEIAVAISTLTSVALAQPLRVRTQAFVDRRFYRSRYDAARTLDDFSVRLRDQVALDAVRADLLAAVRETVQPAHASVWLRGRAE